MEIVIIGSEKTDNCLAIYSIIWFIDRSYYLIYNSDVPSDIYINTLLIEKLSQFFSLIYNKTNTLLKGKRRIDYSPLSDELKTTFELLNLRQGNK
jgi:hypothetical protein